MGRTVDAKELIEALWKCCDEYDFEDDYCNGVMAGITKAIKIIDEQPTVDSVKHGEWVEDICCDEVIICNACGNEAYFDLDVGTYMNFDYCPFCGARMVGEVNGTG